MDGTGKVPNSTTSWQPDGGGEGGMNPWLHPERLIRNWIRHFWLWALLFAILTGGVGYLIAKQYLAASHSLSISLRMAKQTSDAGIVEVGASYESPQLMPAEVQAIIQMRDKFERLRTTFDPNGDYKEFAQRFNVRYSEHARLFTIEVNDCRTPENAEAILEQYSSLIIDHARSEIQLKINKDLDYWRGKVADAKQEVQNFTAKIERYRADHKFVFLEQEIAARQRQISEATEYLANARKRLEDFRSRAEIVIPDLMEKMPQLVDAPNPVLPTISNELQAARDNLRRLSNQLTENHPTIKDAKRLLTELEEEHKQELEKAKEAQKVPNPQLETLKTELTNTKLIIPQLETTVKQAELKLSAAEDRLKPLPRISADFMRLRGEKQQAEERLERLRARVSEIEVAKSRSTSSIELFTPANKLYAIEQPKWVKELIATAAAVFVGLCIAAGIAALFALFDRRILYPSDCKRLLDAEEVERAPRKRAGAAEQNAVLQRITEQLTRRHNRFLVIPDKDPKRAAILARCLAERMAKAGMPTLLVSMDLEPPPDIGQSTGLSNIIAGSYREPMENFLRPLADNLSLLPVGDLMTLLDLVPSGTIEKHLMLVANDFATTIIAAPTGDQALLYRLSQAVDSMVVVTNPDNRKGQEVVKVVKSIDKPVAMAFML